MVVGVMQGFYILSRAGTVSSAGVKASGSRNREDETHPPGGKSMTASARRSLMAVGLAAVLAGGAYQVVAGSPLQRGEREGQEKHPVLRQSMHQLEGVRDRLQHAPTDFGGHREAAVDAISHAINELQQAIQYDKR
jgi:hypothetical protein